MTWPAAPGGSPVNPALTGRPVSRLHGLHAALLAQPILDQLGSDERIITLSITTVGPDGELVQHIAGMTARGVELRNLLIPPDQRAAIAELSDRMVDLTAPDTLGELDDPPGP